MMRYLFFLICLLSPHNLLSAETVNPTSEQTVWLQDQCKEFVHAWKGTWRKFNAAEQRKKILQMGGVRNCEKLATIVKKQKRKTKRAKKPITNPFDPNFEATQMPAAKNVPAVEEISLYMFDSQQKEDIKIKDITATWLLKRFAKMGNAACEDSEKTIFNALDREALKFYAGAGISALGAATMGFDSLVLLASKIGAIQCALSMAPSLAVALLVVRACYHTIVDWATHELIIEMDKDVKNLQDISQERRLKDYVHRVFATLYQAKLVTMLQREVDDKTLDEPLKLLHENISTWSATNKLNQASLSALQSAAKEQVDFLKNVVTKQELSPDVFLKKIMECEQQHVLMKKPAVPMKQKNVNTLQDAAPSIDGNTMHEKDIRSWDWIDSFEDVPESMQADWCKLCNNTGVSGKKICTACNGMRLAKIVLKNSAIKYCKMPDGQAA